MYRMQRPSTVAVALALLLVTGVGCAPAAAPTPTAPPAQPATAPAAKPTEAAKPGAPTPAAKAAPTSAPPAQPQAPASAAGTPATHDELVALANREGEVRALSGLPTAAMTAMAKAFQQKYPSIKATVQELDSSAASQRFLLELQGGITSDWDVTAISTEFYQAFIPFIHKISLLDLAKKRTVNIPAGMIEPTLGNTIGTSSVFQLLAYNKKVVPANQVPSTWEDMLKPEYMGKKFVLDLRGTSLAALVPLWGLERTVDYARKVAQQQPVWIAQAGPLIMTGLRGGEYAMFLGPNFNTIAREQALDTTDSLVYKVIEPVAVRAYSRAEGMLSSAKHPWASVLWMEFQASPEGQAILDEHGPFQSSIYGSGSRVEQEIRGKQLSVVDWQHFTETSNYTKAINEAFGFPQAEVQ